MITRCDRDGGFDDIGRRHDSAELSSGPGLMVVEDEHLAKRRPEEAGQSRLTTAISPRLSNHPCGYEERIVILESPDHDRDDPSIVPLKSHKAPPYRGRQRSSAKRSVRCLALGGRERAARLGQHLVKQRRQVVEVDGKAWKKT